MKKNHGRYIDGRTGTSFYKTYYHMLMRCNNENNKDYHHYGGRGIKCLWKTFEEFKHDMEKKYYKHKSKHDTTEIERIDNNGNYCKGNCRWATRKEQTNNTRRSFFITYNNRKETMSYWSEHFKIGHTTLKRYYLIYKDLGIAVEKFKEAEKYGRGKLITYNNIKGDAKFWAKKLNIVPRTLRCRIDKNGVENALTSDKAPNEGKFIPYKYTYNNKTLTIKEWGDLLGEKPATLNNRIHRLNWPLKKALTIPSERTRLYTYKNKTLCLTDWSKETGIKRLTLWQRIEKYNWPIEKALTKLK